MARHRPPVSTGMAASKLIAAHVDQVLDEAADGARRDFFDIHPNAVTREVAWAARYWADRILDVDVAAPAPVPKPGKPGNGANGANGGHP